MEKNKKRSGSASGKVRLNEDGTAHFEQLDDDGRKDFYTKLIQELADAIPVGSKRITTSGRSATETIFQKKRTILSINIKNDETGQEIATNLVATDLNTLIRHKTI